VKYIIGLLQYLHVVTMGSDPFVVIGYGEVQSDDELSNLVCTFLIVGFPRQTYITKECFCTKIYCSKMLIEIHHTYIADFYYPKLTRNSFWVVWIPRRREGCASLGCSAKPRRRLRGQAASYRTVPPPR